MGPLCPVPYWLPNIYMEKVELLFSNQQLFKVTATVQQPKLQRLIFKMVYLEG